MRHGYGVRQSVPYGMAAVIRSPLRTSINSLRSGSEHSNGAAPPDRGSGCTATGNLPSPCGPPLSGGGPGPGTLTAGMSVCSSTSGGSSGGSGSPAVSRGGFVLTAHSEAELLLRGKRKAGLFRRSILSGLKLRKSESRSSLASQRSKQSSFRSEAGMSTVSSAASDIHSTISLGDGDTDLATAGGGEDDVDATVTETYCGEWKNDKRTGYGVSRRTDGLQYEGEWLSNKRHGYGCTAFPDGTKEEGKYKQNALVSGKRKNLIPLRASKIREKVDRGVEGAQKGGDIARQKAEIALSRTAHAQGKAEAAVGAALKAREESRLARVTAKQFSPSFQHQGNGVEVRRPRRQVSSEVEGEGGVSSSAGTADSPDLCPKTGGASDDPSNDASATRSARFHRQTAVDHVDRGKEPTRGQGGGVSSNHVRREASRGDRSSSQAHWTSRGPPPRGGGGPRSAGGRLLEQDEEKLSNYEMEMKPLQPRDSNAHKPPGHRKEPAAAATRSFPITPERPEQSLAQGKGSSAYSSILVVMVILLNIGVAILFIHFFI
ncbi:hypothetical protein NHX12_003490 [Muraenolepis orangiensis]|uniref:Junctophilin n=1 Tax=Muraenolepis orangiensis TaxID=630683 RepID=A0A9Q0DY54_9TELE|nr:hypothetical protein NHX12_003490 [Muraenolepis orangiensis]